MPEQNLNIVVKKRTMNEGAGAGEYTMYSIYEIVTDAYGMETTISLGEFSEIQIREQISLNAKQLDHWEHILERCLEA